MVGIQRPQRSHQAHFLSNMAAVTLLASPVLLSERQTSSSSLFHAGKQHLAKPRRTDLKVSGRKQFLSKGICRLKGLQRTDFRWIRRRGITNNLENHQCQYCPHPWNINMYTHPRTPLEMHLFRNSQTVKKPFLKFFSLGTWEARSKIVILPNASPYDWNTPIKVNFLGLHTFCGS